RSILVSTVSSLIFKKEETILAINNLIVNGGFETGTLDGWSAVNANVSGLKSHAGRVSAVVMGRSQASLSQTVAISGDQSLELLVSLSKYSLATTPTISIQVAYLNTDNAEVGSGMDVEIPYNSLPNAFFGSWREMYQVTD